MKQHADINFAADDAHRFLPWLVGIMVCLAAMLLCLSLTLNGWIIDRGDGYAGSFTVNIPAGTDNLSEKTNRIASALKALPEVTDVSRLSEDKLKDMLAPWLGNADGLPLPVVLDVTLKSASSSIDYNALEKTLSGIASGTEVDAHERWVAAFSRFSAAAQGLIAIFAAVIIGGIGLMIAFTSRASLKLHNKTVHLLHSIGAEDSYITRQFQREACLLVLPGAVAGCAAAGTIYWLAGKYMASLAASVIPSLAMGGGHVALLILIPPACAGVAWAAVRVAVAQQLESVL